MINAKSLGLDRPPWSPWFWENSDVDIEVVVDYDEREEDLSFSPRWPFLANPHPPIGFHWSGKMLESAASCMIEQEILIETQGRALAISDAKPYAILTMRLLGKELL